MACGSTKCASVCTLRPNQSKEGEKKRTGAYSPLSSATIYNEITIMEQVFFPFLPFIISSSEFYVYHVNDSIFCLSPHIFCPLFPSSNNFFFYFFFVHDHLIASNGMFFGFLFLFFIDIEE